jgi:hypothetical protein
MSARRLILKKMTAKIAFGANLLAEHTLKKNREENETDPALWSFSYEVEGTLHTYHKCLFYRTLWKVAHGSGTGLLSLSLSLSVFSNACRDHHVMCRP